MASIISLSDVSVTYNKGRPNEVEALKHVSLEIEEGAFIGITGVSGSGKSTLLHLLGGLIPPDSGQYTYNGRNMCRIKESVLSSIRNKEFGYVLQEFGLLGDRSALENVCLPLMFSDIKWSAIEKRGMASMEKLHIAGLKNKKVSEMSGGQCQRVAIARAMVNHPKVLLADEPTGALDSYNANLFVQLLKEVNKSGTTIILVTHDLSITAYCSELYTLEDGILHTWNVEK